MPETTTLTPASTKEAIDRLEAYLTDSRAPLYASDIRMLLQIWGSRQWAGVRGAIEIALAVHDGVPGGRPTTDAQALRATADWMDILDDATDQAFLEGGNDHKVEREMQSDLRRIAARLERLDDASGS